MSSNEGGGKDDLTIFSIKESSNSILKKSSSNINIDFNPQTEAVLLQIESSVYSDRDKFMITAHTLPFTGGVSSIVFVWILLQSGCVVIFCSTKLVD